MSTITLPKTNVNRARAAPIVVLLTNENVRIVRQVELEDLHALARWLAEEGAEHHGRAGFLIPSEEGEPLRCVIMRDGITWGWRYLKDEVRPLFERYRRLVSRPRLHAPARFSHHSVSKAEQHAVRLAGQVRYEVVSGESGNRYTVTVRSQGTPRVECTCPHGKWQARRRRDAACSHAAAVEHHAHPPLRRGA